MQNSFFCLLLVGFLFYSCQNDFLPGEYPEKEEVETPSKTLPEQTQEYIEKSGDIFCSIFEDKQEFLSKASPTLNPDWKHTVAKELSDRHTMEVPLTSGKNEKTRIKFLKNGQEKEHLCPIEHKLFVHKNKKTGKFYHYISSVIQLNDRGCQDSLENHYLIVDYRSNHGIITIREIQNNKMKLLKNVEDEVADSACYEVSLAGVSRQYVYNPTNLEKLKCPVCDTKLSGGGYCMFHGYILDPAFVFKHPDFSGIISTVVKNVCSVVMEARYFHYTSNRCTGMCSYCNELRDYLAYRFSACLYHTNFCEDLFRSIGDATLGFVERYNVDLYNLQMDHNEGSWWLFLNDVIEFQQQTLIWNLTMALEEYDCVWGPTVPDPGAGGGSGGGSDSGEDIQDPDPDDNYSHALLTVEYTKVELMDNYTMTVKITPTGGIAPVIEMADFLIRRKGTEQWQFLGQESNGNQLTYTRVAISPGFFELKVEAHINGSPMMESNIVEVEEQFPPIYVFENNFEIRNTAVSLWNKTVAFATQNQSTRQVREYGCLIFLNTENGEYSIGPVIEGNVVTLDHDVTATVNFVYNESMPDPRQPYTYAVGTLHSHYPLTWAISGAKRLVGPSPYDNNGELPGIVYDYTENIKGGDPVVINNNPMRYYRYGGERRATPNI